MILSRDCAGPTISAGHELQRLRTQRNKEKGGEEIPTAELGNGDLKRMGSGPERSNFDPGQIELATQIARMAAKSQ